MKNNPKSRRQFLLKCFFEKSELVSELAALTDDEGNDKIRLLTSDGKLVEVSSKTVQDRKATSKTGNKEILKWMQEGKDKL